MPCSIPFGSRKARHLAGAAPDCLKRRRRIQTGSAASSPSLLPSRANWTFHSPAHSLWQRLKLAPGRWSDRARGSPAFLRPAFRLWLAGRSADQARSEAGFACLPRTPANPSRNTPAARSRDGTGRQRIGEAGDAGISFTIFFQENDKRLILLTKPCPIIPVILTPAGIHRSAGAVFRFLPRTNLKATASPSLKPRNGSPLA